MPEIRVLTTTQMRVLLYLNRNPTLIHPLALMDGDSRLGPDDIVVIPSLVEGGYIHYYRHCRGVSLAYPGRQAAERHVILGLIPQIKPPTPFDPRA